MERPSFLPEKNIEKLEFKNYFERADIVVLGEDLRHGVHTETILAALEKFKDNIQGLFVELSVDLQPAIENYLKTGNVDKDLDYLFQGALEEGKDLRAGTLSILDKAAKIGIKVICYDAAEHKVDENYKRAKHGYWFIKSDCRDEEMFNNVNEYYQSHGGKYLVVIGGHHIGNENFEGDYKNFGPRLKDGFADRCVLVRMTRRGYVFQEKDAYDDTIIA